MVMRPVFSVLYSLHLLATVRTCNVASKRISVAIAAMLCFGCYNPSDRELADKFKRNRVAFEQLVAMIDSDKKVMRVAIDSFDVIAPNGQRISSDNPESACILSAERFKQYRELLRKASVEAVSSNERGEVHFSAASGGLAVSGWSAGYAFCNTPPSPIVDDFKDAPAWGFVYVPIDKGWYMTRSNN
jgi:hypothetical protein